MFVDSPIESEPLLGFCFLEGRPIERRLLVDVEESSVSSSWALENFCALSSTFFGKRGALNEIVVSDAGSARDCISVDWAAFTLEDSVVLAVDAACPCVCWLDVDVEPWLILVDVDGAGSFEIGRLLTVGPPDGGLFVLVIAAFATFAYVGFPEAAASFCINNFLFCTHDVPL